MPTGIGIRGHGVHHRSATSIPDNGGADRILAFTPTSFSERRYCGDCGTPLTIHVAHQADELDIAVGSLDDPSAVAPGFHIYMSHAPDWLRPLDGLPTFDELRPATRGLPEGKTTLPG
ncbi:GFA family protein [Sphingomonas rhizophila]|uniref:GFA family protein n=1 Tax=Sphingomonas rhizophila TaxID=2071607 RepID=A0A7G9SBP7_9SPHN|nr:GFA family protein [Sphingomonas rhizophila]